jgi:hypothetical protein
MGDPMTLASVIAAPFWLFARILKPEWWAKRREERWERYSASRFPTTLGQPIEVFRTPQEALQSQQDVAIFQQSALQSQLQQQQDPF